MKWRRESNKLPWDSVKFDRRLLTVMTGLTSFAILIMIIAVGTDYWIVLTIPGGAWRNSTQMFVTGTISGLWRICRKEVDNFKNPTTSRESCEYHKLFPTMKEVNRDPEVDKIIIDYSRTETAFAVISLLIMLVGNGFALYTFKEHRYMFKRLTAFTHFVVAALVLVVLEVLINSIHYEESNLPARHPERAYHSFGFSFAFGWIVFIIYVSAGIAFLFASRKRKGDQVQTEIDPTSQIKDDEAINLGRV
ncbi:unnamed protein product [Owenia fusiformis]|uniref:Uncharacterized protein n=1 Tax=Owenia fusiformis TaxID=6347 RepID=A0A8J1ULU3_OWEFU|nr:unnamed protein product [Owenia fusiformis]